MVRAALVIIALAILGLAPPVSADSSSQQISGLIGLKTIGLEVIVDKGAAAAGVSKDEIQTKTEVALREAGLKIGTYPVDPQLCIEIDSIPESGALVYSVDVSLTDWVIPERHTTILNLVKKEEEPPYEYRVYNGIWSSRYTMLIDVWRWGIFGYCGTEKIDAVAKTADDIVEKFINDYLIANPKPSPAASAKP